MSAISTTALCSKRHCKPINNAIEITLLANEQKCFKHSLFLTQIFKNLSFFYIRKSYKVDVYRLAKE